MSRKKILDGIVMILFGIGVFGLGWVVAGRMLDLKEVSKNFEASIYQSQVGAGLIGKLSSIQKEKGLKMVFVGDVMLSRGVANQINKNQDFSYPFREVSGYLNSFDLAIANLEGPISDRGKNQGSIYSFRADPKVAEGLRSAGFDVLALANNHMMDWGREALIDTYSILERNGIAGVGAGKDYTEANQPAMFEIKGQKLAFLSYTNLYPKSLEATETSAGISDSRIENIIFNILELKEKGYFVTVLMHWGDEYQTKSNTSQQKSARGFIDAGADLVVGTHPHVPQEIEEYRTPPSSETPARRGWIAYSLGNFVFDQNFSEETMKGMAVEVEVRDGGVVGVVSREVEINPTFQPSLVK